MRWQAQTLHDATVAVDGHVAVLAATVVDEVLYAEQPSSWEFVATQTYVEWNGEWLYLAGHTALPAT